MSACALVLLVVPTTAQSHAHRDAGARPTRHLATMKKDRQKAAAAKHAPARTTRARRFAVAASTQPRRVICRVFGDYCRQAIQVSHCESRLRTDAQNGQYVGLFQMGANERQLYGHGSSALAQARAAHRYFVASGHNWGPWSCKPWS